MSPMLSRRLVAMTLAAALVGLQAAPGAWSADTALFRGRVVAPDGATPRAGVTITLVDEDNDRVFRSEPSDDRGAFHLDSALPGSYTLVAESTEGAFVAQGKVNLEEGGNPAVALSLQPAQQEGEEPDPAETPADEPGDDPAGDVGEGEGDAETGSTSLPPAPAEKEGLSPVVKTVITVVVGVLAVAVILEVSDEEKSGSAF